MAKCAAAWGVPDLHAARVDKAIEVYVEHVRDLYPENEEDFDRIRATAWKQVLDS